MKKYTWSATYNSTTIGLQNTELLDLEWDANLIGFMTKIVHCSKNLYGKLQVVMGRHPPWDDGCTQCQVIQESDLLLPKILIVLECNLTIIKHRGYSRFFLFPSFPFLSYLLFSPSLSLPVFFEGVYLLLLDFEIYLYYIVLASLELAM